MRIGNRHVGPDYAPYFVADIGANHDGDLGRALHLIDLAAEAGVDAVKFQSFRAELIVSRRGFEEVGKIGHQAAWGQDVYDAYRDAATPVSWVPDLAERCSERGVAFMTTPYDLELVDLLDEYVPAWKIGSGDITWPELITKIASKGKPVLLATGASTYGEVDAAVGYFLDGQTCLPEDYLVLMQCNTNYTGDSDNLYRVNLKVLDRFRDDYYPLLGISDHTVGYLVACGAVARGACVVEKHFTDDHTRSGPDHGFAMEPEEWREMVEAASAVWIALGDGTKRVEKNEQEARIIQRRALRWAGNPSAGEKINRRHLAVTRPCPVGALEPYCMEQVIGRRLKRDVERDTLVRLEDLE